jgi:hypothetical protein
MAWRRRRQWRHGGDQSSAYGGVMAASTAYHERNGGENISVAAANGIAPWRGWRLA